VTEALGDGGDIGAVLHCHGGHRVAEAVHTDETGAAWDVFAEAPATIGKP
jgi:hypothetical protein